MSALTACVRITLNAFNPKIIYGCVITGLPASFCNPGRPPTHLTGLMMLIIFNHTLVFLLFDELFVYTAVLDDINTTQTLVAIIAV